MLLLEFSLPSNSWIFCPVKNAPMWWLPWWRSGLEFACQCRGHRLESWSGKIPHAREQLSPCTTTTEPALWSPGATTTEVRTPRTRAPQKEKPPWWEAHAPKRRVAPACWNSLKALTQQGRPNAAKNKKTKKPPNTPMWLYTVTFKVCIVCHRMDILHTYNCFLILRYLGCVPFFTL